MNDAITQVDHILVERLQGTWQKGLLAGARSASADLAHKLDEHDAAQKRYLGHKCACNAVLLLPDWALEMRHCLGGPAACLRPRTACSCG